MLSNQTSISFVPHLFGGGGSEARRERDEFKDDKRGGRVWEEREGMRNRILYITHQTI